MYIGDPPPSLRIKVEEVRDSYLGLLSDSLGLYRQYCVLGGDKQDRNCHLTLSRTPRANIMRILSFKVPILYKIYTGILPQVNQFQYLLRA
jgi:hypothetical protein